MGTREPGEGLEGLWHAVGTSGFNASVLPALGFVLNRVFQKQSEHDAGKPCSTSWTASTSHWRCGSCSSCRDGLSRYPEVAGSHWQECRDCVFLHSEGSFAAPLECSHT